MMITNRFFGVIMLSYLVVMNISAQSKDLLSAEYFIRLDTNDLSVSGRAVYVVKILSDTDTVRFDADDVLGFQEVKVDGRNVRFDRKDGKLVIRHRFVAGKEVEIAFKWSGKPRRGMYFTGWKTGGRKQIWTQGQGKKNSGWMPVVDNMNEKFSWIIHVRFDSTYQVISNGVLKEKRHLNGETEWTFVQNKPASSYLIFLGTGRYDILKDTTGKNRVPVEQFVYRGDASYGVTYHDFDKAFDFIESYLETPYPWPVYRQLPIRDFFYGGMENLMATTFNEHYYVDSISVNDTDPFNVLAHELAHQWFGDWVTEKASRDHWLHESFATFLAREAEKKLYGKDDYDFKNYTEKRRIIDAYYRGDTVPLQNAKAGSLTFYQKGAWILRMMRDRVGEEKFRLVLKNFLKKYAYQNASTEDFQRVLYETVHDSLPDFFERWFRSAYIPKIKIRIEANKLKAEGDVKAELPIRLYFRDGRYKDLIIKGNQTLATDGVIGYIPDPENRFLYDLDWELPSDWMMIFRFEKNWINLYRLTEKIPADTLQRYFRFFKDIMSWDYYYPLNYLIVNKLGSVSYDMKMEAAKILLRKKDLNQRRLALMLFDKIPVEMREDYEMLLRDSSYETKKLALERLAVDFPAERKRYLDMTGGVRGGSDRSFRMLWLVVAISTKGYTNVEERKRFLRELIEYASPAYSVQVRMVALGWIDRLGLYVDPVNQWLEQAAGYFHPSLSRYAMELMEKSRKKMPAE